MPTKIVKRNKIVTKAEALTLAQICIKNASLLIGDHDLDVETLQPVLTALINLNKYAKYYDPDIVDEITQATASIRRMISAARKITINNDVVTMIPKKNYPTAISKKDIEQFNGDPADWKRWKSLFIVQVINNYNIDSILKVELLAHGIPDRADTIRGYGHDYIAALDQMEQLIAKPSAVKISVIRRANNIAILPNNAKYPHWNKLVESIQSIIQASDPNDISQQINLYAILTGKLGSHELDYRMKSNEENLKDLLEYARKIEDACQRMVLSEATRNPNGTFQKKNNDPDISQKRRNQGQTRDGTYAINATTVKNPPLPCLFCNGNHWNKNCDLSHTERRKRLRNNKRCWRCFKPFDEQHKNECNKTCQKCGKNFHVSVCVCGNSDSNSSISQRSVEKEQASTFASLSESQQTENVTTAVAIQYAFNKEPIYTTVNIKDKKKYLGTVSLDIINGITNEVAAGRAFLDPGSHVSYGSEPFLNLLGCKIHEMPPIKIQSFQTKKLMYMDKGATIKIRSKINPNIEHNLTVYVVRGTIVGELPKPSKELATIAERYDVKLADPPIDDTSVIDLLIGVDDYSRCFTFPGAQIYKPVETLTFQETPYGWIFQGSANPFSTKSAQSNMVLIQNDSSECLCKDLQKILHDPLSASDKDEIKESWMEDYINTIKHNPLSKRYEVGLPWYNTRRPDSNYQSHVASIQFTYRSLIAKGLFDLYTEHLMELVKNGYAKELTAPFPRDGHYVRHFPVFKAGSTTEVRPVFDASSGIKSGHSLNSCKGAWTQNYLMDILIKWRFNPIVLTADIKKAFLQIRIREEDCKYLRFMWIIDNKLKAFEMTSLLFGASASPFILYAVLKNLIETRMPDLREIVDNIYMDDALLFADSLPALKELFTRLSEIMNEASFELHKLISTPDVTRSLNIEVTKEIASILGVKWHLATDSIIFVTNPSIDSPSNLTVSTPSIKYTRRNLVSFFSKVFDPLGLLGPMHTTIKLFIQSIIKSNSSWDDQVSSELQDKAQRLIKELEYINKVTIPRIVVFEKDFEIWCFGDASALAYGICLYVHNRISKETNLLLSRSRLASQKQTIPRLELVATLLAAIAYESVCKCFKSKDKFDVKLFTDSMVTLHRLQSDPSKHDPYVSSRIVRIRNIINPSKCFHIPGKFNPADLVSRGISLPELLKSEIWFKGPPFEEIQRAELNTAYQIQQVNAIVSKDINDDFDIFKRLIENKYFIFPRLRHIIYRLLVYMQKYSDLTERYKTKNGNTQLSSLADFFVWKIIQRVLLQNEIEALYNNTKMPITSPFYKRNIFMDEFGLLRLHRRIDQAALPPEAKDPLIIIDHPVIRRYIKYIHENQTNHSGASMTIRYFRQYFHLPNVYRIVISVVSECLTCRRYRTATPYSAPMCDLPSDRVTIGYTFQAIGIDIFGPLHTSKSSNDKYYGLIFTCNRSRAIHLEAIDNRSTEAILRAFSRFSSLFGVPKIIRSDNELGFIKLGKALKEIYIIVNKALDQLEEKYGSNVQWIRNVPAAPHWGGHYERLISDVKKVINKLRLSSADTFEKVETFLREAQQIVNARPLLTNFTDQPLTPFHLLYGRAIEPLPPVTFPISIKDPVFIEYARLQKDLTQFWQVWNEIYLPSLQAIKWPQTIDPKIGELVIIKKDGINRRDWELARIKEVKPGKDGKIRSALIEPCNGSGDKRRLIHLLYPIERLAGEKCGSPELNTD